MTPRNPWSSMIPNAPAFHENALLFGHDPTPRLLAFELTGDDRIRVFARTVDGQTGSDLRPFRPFVLLASTDLLTGWAGGYEVEELEGDGLYRFLVFFPGWGDALRARAHVQKVTGKAQAAPDAPFLFFTDRQHRVGAPHLGQGPGRTGHAEGTGPPRPGAGP
ncbi:MAG: hypothetical protein HY766_00705 [candidate division NC10 bacterium]|nr:hypothetical protein [candidate division NC10 bacterium]